RDQPEPVAGADLHQSGDVGRRRRGRGDLAGRGRLTRFSEELVDATRLVLHEELDGAGRFEVLLGPGGNVEDRSGSALEALPSDVVVQRALEQVDGLVTVMGVERRC